MFSSGTICRHVLVPGGVRNPERDAVLFCSEQPVAELDETVVTLNPETDQEADEYAERHRHYRHGVDTIFIVDLERAQREHLRLFETATKSVLCYQANPSRIYFKSTER